MANNGLKTSDSVWVERHYCLLRDYLFHKFPNSIEHREFMISIFQDYTNSYSTRTILEDYQKSNQEKLNYFLTKFQTQSLICLLVAGRGKGKTAFSVYFLKELSRFKPIYALYPFNKNGKLPYVTCVYDISQVPVHSILYIDELAKRYKARDFASKEALAMTDELIGLRHNHISVFGGTQDLSLIDKNYILLSDIQIWKNYNLQNEELTREGFITDLVRQLMPTSDDSLTNVLVNHAGEISTFSHPLIEDSKEISTYLSELRTDDKAITINYLKKYYEGKALLDLLKTQYNIMLTISEQKQYLKK